ncbi:MAG TPA: response regulator [Alphaproteobacteria bacterium]|nr:response regulator [Alphaproteobacteria bacterium]
MQSKPLAGARILVIEDEVLVSMLIEDALGESGCDLVGPARSVAQGVALAASETLSAAVLDVNVDGGEIFPVAEILSRRGIPYLFITGYRRSELPSRHRDAPTLEKPFGETMLVDAVRSLIRSELSHQLSARLTAATRESGR